MRRRFVDAMTNDLLLKLTALGLAFLLWTTVKTPDPVAIDGIPVTILVHDAGWALAGEPEPPNVTVEFTGPLRQLVRVATERPPIVVGLDQVTDSVETVPLRSTALSLGAGMEDIRIEAIRPISVTARFDRISNRTVPVSVNVIGSPVPGFEMAGRVAIEPVTVRATGPTRILDQLDTLRLPAIDLTQRTSTDTVVVTIGDLPREVTVEPTQVRVILPIRPVAADTGGVALPADTPSGRGGQGRRP